MTSISPTRLGLLCKPLRSNSAVNINTHHHQTNLTQQLSGSFDVGIKTHAFHFFLLDGSAKQVHVLPSVKFPSNMANTVNKSNRPAHGKLEMLKYHIDITKVLTISN